MIHVLLPAFNEEAVIGPTVAGIAAVAATMPDPVRVVLVDDGSSDATVERATAAAAAGSIDLLVLSHEQNGGLGAAIRTGIYRIVDDAGPSDVVMAMDADSTHPADSMPRMVDLVHRGADVVIASRYVPGATVTGVPAYRRVLSDGGRWLFRLAFPIPGVRDYTCGFRAYAIEPLRRARVVYGDELCTQRGFEATVDLLLRLRQVGISAAEVPLHLDYSSRVGVSKMRVWRTIRSTLWLLGRRWVERFTTYSPRRVRAMLATGPEAAS